MDRDAPTTTRAFFGRRKGHPLKPRQAALFDALLPRLAVDLTKPAPADLRTLFATPLDDMRLEIGFGGAEHLIAQAQAHPRTGFIGTDAFVNAVAKALAAVDEHKLANIRFYFGDASELLDWLPNAALSRIDLLYPDPWPKRRHWKRRFIQDDNLRRLARLLKKGGELRFGKVDKNACQQRDDKKPDQPPTHKTNDFRRRILRKHLRFGFKRAGRVGFRAHPPTPIC